LNFQDVVKEHVALQRSHEEERGGAGIANVQYAGLHRAPHVVRHQLERALGRIFAFGIERQNERRSPRVFERGDNEPRCDDAGDEWDDLLSQPAKNDRRVDGGVDRGEIEHTLRWVDETAALHRLGEERRFRVDVTEDCGRGDADFAGDVGQRGSFEALLGKQAPGAGQDVFATNAWWAAHS